jgi:hypothetical protein
MIIQIGSVLATPDARDHILENGFFFGWNTIAIITCLITWCCYLGASTVTAYISAMAASMCQAIVVVIVGLFGFLVQGDEMLPMQIVLIAVIALNSAMYAYFKDKQKQQLLESLSPEEGETYWVDFDPFTGTPSASVVGSAVGSVRHSTVGSVRHSGFHTPQFPIMTPTRQGVGSMVVPSSINNPKLDRKGLGMPVIHSEGNLEELGRKLEALARDRSTSPENRD